MGRPLRGSWLHSLRQVHNQECSCRASMNTIVALIEQWVKLMAVEGNLGSFGATFSNDLHGTVAVWKFHFQLLAAIRHGEYKAASLQLLVFLTVCRNVLCMASLQLPCGFVADSEFLNGRWPRKASLQLACSLFAAALCISPVACLHLCAAPLQILRSFFAARLPCSSPAAPLQLPCSICAAPIQLLRSFFYSSHVVSSQLLAAPLEHPMDISSSLFDQGGNLALPATVCAAYCTHKCTTHEVQSMLLRAPHGGGTV
jgi:hypothetical protein